MRPMTIRTVLERGEPALTWLDVVQPTPEELDEVADRYGLYPVAVKDCLDPEHLPKQEGFEAHTFIIPRACDEAADAGGVTVQELTRKIAIFYGPRAPMERIEARLDGFETKVFSRGTESSADFRRDLREIYVLKHQVTVYERLLWRTADIVQHIVPTAGRAATLFRDVLRNAESYHFYADELLDDANTLLNVQLALASHRTGEVMRVLTVFSVFFLPLTFIVGVYGMNFRFMPELRERWGYPAVLGGMALVTLLIYRWFRSRGRLRE